MNIFVEGGFEVEVNEVNANCVVGAQLCCTNVVVSNAIEVYWAYDKSRCGSSTPDPIGQSSSPRDS